MADSKKRKKVRQREIPSGKSVVQREQPGKIYQERPAWRFVNSDTKMWEFTQERLKDVWWSEILPYLKSNENRRWSEIFVEANKQNHSLKPKNLNLCAIKRLEELRIEQDAIYSLRVTGKHRIYGYFSDKVFNILWFDDDHGDNETCVCPSRKKHT